MNKTKKQHYVPQFYLRNFSRSDKKFTVIDMSSKKVDENIHCRNKCYEDYYYGNDEKWEKELGKIESLAAEVIKKIINSNNYYPTLNEIKTLKKYILFQRNRTVGNANNLLNTELEILETSFKNLSYKYSDNILSNVKKVYKNNEEPEIPQKTLELVSKVAGAIDDLDFIIINYNTNKNKLISSDNPVIFYNFFSVHSIGFLSAGLIVLLPINESKLIVLFDSKIYPKYRNKKIITSNNEKEVQMLNIFQLVSAKDIVYFNDRSQISDILSLLNYVQNRKKSIIAPIENIALETEKGKINNIRPAHIIFKYKFSFCKLHPRINKLNITEFDFFPRIRSKEYEESMIEKQKIFKINKVGVKPSKHQIKDMNNLDKFICDYWNDKL